VIGVQGTTENPHRYLSRRSSYSALAVSRLTPQQRMRDPDCSRAGPLKAYCVAPSVSCLDPRHWHSSVLAGAYGDPRHCRHPLWKGRFLQTDFTAAGAEPCSERIARTAWWVLSPVRPTGVRIEVEAIGDTTLYSCRLMGKTAALASTPVPWGTARQRGGFGPGSARRGAWPSLRWRAVGLATAMAACASGAAQCGCTPKRSPSDETSDVAAAAGFPSTAAR